MSNKSPYVIGCEPWSSGYGMRLLFWRLCVEIPAPYTGWTFFHIKYVGKIVMILRKRPKINQKEAGYGSILKMFIFIVNFSGFKFTNNFQRIFCRCSPCSRLQSNMSTISRKITNSIIDIQDLMSSTTFRLRCSTILWWNNAHWIFHVMWVI